MTARDWLKKAKSEKFAIGAFNVGSLETFKAIAQAAANKKSPVIIESSPGETKWMEAENIVDIAKNFSQEYGIPILVNLDHAETLEDCQNAIEVGFNLIHFDGGKLSFEQNVEITKKVVELSHGKNLLAEGEIDHIQGSSEMHSGSAEAEASKAKFTDPEKAKEFVAKTGVDIFAAFFGNVHGVYSGGDENLNLELLKRIADAIPNIFLSLHGGSGIPDNQVKTAINLGIVKVNVNTEMREAFRKSLEIVLKDNPEELALYKVEPPVVAAVQKVVEWKMEVFGSVNKA